MDRQSESGLWAGSKAMETQNVVDQLTLHLDRCAVPRTPLRRADPRGFAAEPGKEPSQIEQEVPSGGKPARNVIK
jgi:hypothetical protein